MSHHYLPWILLFVFSMPSLAFDAADLAKLKTQKFCVGCDLRSADLRGFMLVRAGLRWSRLEKADLRGVDLSGADLTGASLAQARLEGASLRGARLEGANLVGTALSTVGLVGADLRWADLSHLDVDTDLEFVELVGVQLEGTRFKHGMRCAAFPAKGGWGCTAVLPAR